MEKPKIATRAAARLLHEGALALAEVERVGIRVDREYLDRHTKETEEEIAAIKRNLYKSDLWGTWERKHGNKAKLSSRKQLGGIIFGDLKYKRREGLAKKDKGSDDGIRRQPKYDEAAFQDVDLPFIKQYFRLQKLEKLYGTYLQGISREEVDGRIHPFFDLHKAVTYRGSSSLINFQNIPNRNAEVMKRIRRAFIPDDGCHLIEMDYSGVEVRSACCYTKDPRLIDDFTKPGSDPHGDTALELFGLTRSMLKPPTDLAPEQAEEWSKRWKKGPRDWAKNRFVFPQFFGSVHFQCAPHLWEAVISGALMPDGEETVRDFLKSQGITKLGDCSPDGNAKPGTFVHRVKQVEDGFWNKRFKVYTAWKNRWWNNYLTKGWFETFSGFVFSGLYGRNDALNYPIQGFAFHWLLKSVIILIKELKRRKMQSLIIGQIHDCLLASVPNDEVQDFVGLALEVMTKKIPQHWPKIIVPLEVEVESCGEGQSWADKRVLKKNAKGLWA